jgi:predicted ribosome quality control (RQC) complex YloA/Tae2 family protein
LVNKEFKVDPSIFKDYYDDFIQKIKVEEENQRELEKINKQKLDEEEKLRKMLEEKKKEKEEIKH